MLSIKQVRGQLTINNWEMQKAIIDSNCNRIIELNTSRMILLELLAKLLDDQLYKKQLVSKVS